MATDNNKVLLPCPFCGCKGIEMGVLPDEGWVFCPSCGARMIAKVGMFKTPQQEAVRRWNRRVASSEALWATL